MFWGRKDKEFSGLTFSQKEIALSADSSVVKGEDSKEGYLRLRRYGLMVNGMADRSARACRSDPWEKAFF